LQKLEKQKITKHKHGIRQDNDESDVVVDEDDLSNVVDDHITSVTNRWFAYVKVNTTSSDCTRSRFSDVDVDFGWRFKRNDLGRASYISSRRRNKIRRRFS